MGSEEFSIADDALSSYESFYIWAAKGHQLQDRSKVKSWLFTTLHREFHDSLPFAFRRRAMGCWM